MQEFEIKISKQELNILIMALKDSQDRLDEILGVIYKPYYELLEKEKLFWRNKSEYDKYRDNLRKDCCKQSDDAYKSQEKLQNILDLNK